jgi:hypothetical protein
MVIPYELVELLLDQELTAHKAFLVSYPLLEDNDTLNICSPLLEFLQIAATQPTEGNPHPFTLQDRLGMVDYPVRPAMPSQHRTSVLYRLLPDLHPMAQATYRITSLPVSHMASPTSPRRCTQTIDLEKRL